MRKNFNLKTLGIVWTFLSLLFTSPTSGYVQDKIQQAKQTEVSSRAGESKHITFSAKRRKIITLKVNRENYPDGTNILVRVINPNNEGDESLALASELVGLFKVNQNLIEFTPTTDQVEVVGGSTRLYEGSAIGFYDDGSTPEISIFLNPDNPLFGLELELDVEVNNPSPDGNITVSLLGEEAAEKRLKNPKSNFQTQNLTREANGVAATTACQTWALYSPQYFAPSVGVTINEGKTFIGSPFTNGMSLFDISRNPLLVRQILRGGAAPTPILAPDRLADQQYQAFQLSFVTKGIAVGSLLYHTHTDDVALSCYNFRSTVTLSTGYKISPTTTLAELESQLRFGMYEYRYGFTAARYNDLNLVGLAFRSLPKIR